MAKKRYSYVGVSVFLALLIPTPVFSDAPSYLMREKFRNFDSQKNSPEEIGGQPHVSSKKKPNQVQGSNDPSSRKNSVRGGGIQQRGSKPAGITSVQEQRENPGKNNSSSGVLSNEARQNPTNKPSGESSETGQTSQPLPIVGGSNTSGVLSNGARQNPTNKPSGESSETGQTSQPLPIVGGSNTSGVLSNGARQNATNKPSGESSETGQTSQPLPIVGGSNTSGVLSNGARQNATNKPSGESSGTGQTSQPSSIVGGSNTSPSGRKIDSGVDSSTLNSLFKNPFAWLLLLLLLGLLALLLWWLRKRRQQQINQYVDQIFEQKIKNNIGFIINNFVNQEEFKHYIDQYLVRQIDSSFEQKIKNNIPLITHNIANDNQELNHYIDQRLQHSVINNTRITADCNFMRYSNNSL